MTFRHTNLIHYLSVFTKRRHSLRWRLLAVMGSMILIMLIVIGMSVFYFIDANEQEFWQERQAEAASQAAGSVTVFVQRMADTLNVVGSLQQQELTSSPELLDRLLRQNPALIELIRLDSNGHVLAGAFQDEPVLGNQFTIPQSRWFIGSQAGELYLGEVQISAASEPYLVMSMPAPDGGVVAARLRMNILWDLVEGLRFGETGQAYVVNSVGQVVAHTRPETALAHTSLTGRPEMSALLAAPGQAWGGAYQNFEGTEVLGVTRPVPGTGWIVITEVAKAEAFATSRTALLLLSGGLALFGLLVMLVTGQFLGTLILRPMEQLRAGTERIGQGDLNHQIYLPQTDEVGQVARAFNDMVERLRDRDIQVAERNKALLVSEDRFRQVVTSISDHVYMTEISEEHGRVNGYLSPNVEELTGYPAEKFLADWSFWPSTVIHPDDQANAANQAALLAQGKNSEIEYRLVKADGTTIWVRDSARAVKDPVGQKLIVYGIVNDISERKKTERAVQQQRDFLQQVIDVNPHFIFAKDREGRFTLANQAFAKSYGTTVDKLLGKTEADYNPDLKLVVKYRRDDMTVIESNQELFIPEEKISKPDGQELWRQTIKCPIVDEDGEVTQVLGVATDITELKQVELILTRARDEALEASRFKSELVAKVSHELRTPLGSILGFAEMLQDGLYGPVSGEQQEVTENIIESTQYLTGRVNELLDQARLEAGKLKLQVNTFAPSGLVDDIVSTMSVLAANKGLTLITDIAPELPTLVDGDQDRLKQILINLVGNAVKFTEQGTVELRLYRPDATHWALEVTDTGPGIPPEDQSDIFESFKQVDGSITRQHIGTGLGLSIVKQLTGLMAGQVNLQSEVGQGSTFTVLLPLERTEELVI